MTTFGDLADILPSDEEDEDDEEYVPSENEESSSDEEEVVEENDEDEDKGKKSKNSSMSKRSTTKKSKNEIISRKRRRGCFTDDGGGEGTAPKVDSGVDEEEEEPAAKRSETDGGGTDGKVCSDSLWSSFLQRSGQSIKRSSAAPKPEIVSTSAPANRTFRPAGRESADSNGSKPERQPDAPANSVGSALTPAQREQPPAIDSGTSGQARPLGAASNGQPRRPGGVQSLLSSLSKKSKVTVLEKSRRDWNSFKDQEGIDEDLKIHNRGKDGYLERVAFLERTDRREFELERDLRQGARREKRF